MKSVLLICTAALLTGSAIAVGVGGIRPAFASTALTLKANQPAAAQANVPIKVGDPIIIKDKKPKK
jgi:hypothetical protein